MPLDLKALRVTKPLDLETLGQCATSVPTLPAVLQLWHVCFKGFAFITQNLFMRSMCLHVYVKRAWSRTYPDLAFFAIQSFVW